MPIEHDKGDSPEERNEPNYQLHAHWERVFRKIPGFENCTCLRRVRCPDHKGDMDFLLVTAGPEPQLGLVEVEGYDATGRRDKPVSHQGTDQLATYLERFRPFRGNGQAILQESIKNAFEVDLRKRHNVKQWPGGVLEWARKADPGIQSEQEVADLLLAASKQLVAILLYFTTSELRSSPTRSTPLWGASSSTDRSLREPSAGQRATP